MQENRTIRPSSQGGDRFRRQLLARVCVAAVALSAAPSLAAEADTASSNAAVIEEIVVTAQRFEQNLQKTPVAISAVTGAQLAKSGVTNPMDLQYLVPNATFAQFKGEGQYSLRGIGNDNLTIGGDPGVAFHQDGVYLTRNAVANGEFFDTDRIEILRGPQGTLYGRNAVGGVINVISTKPTHEFEGLGDVLVGNYSRTRVRGAINVPLSDTLSARISAVSDQRDGYVLNVFNKTRVEDNSFRGIRGHLRFEPTSDMDFLLSVTNERQRGTGLVRRLFTPQISPEILALRPGPDPTDPFEINHDVNDIENVDHTGVSLTADIDLGFATLRSITASNQSRVYQFRDLENTSANFGRVGRTDKDNTWTQEVQLTGKSFDERLQWVLGGFYMDNSVTNDVPYQIPVGLLHLAARQDLQAKAVFAQGTYSVTPELRLTAGLRYSKENKKLFENNVAPPALGGNRSRTTRYENDAWTPRFTAEYDLTSQVMLYASATRGFKSGGFNSSGFAPPFNPETVWAYEGGVKSSWLDRRLQINVAAFKYDYTDLQVLTKQPGDIVFSVKNASSADIKGLELEVTAIPTESLRLNLALGFLDATYDGLFTNDATRPALGVLDLSGNRLPRSPKYKGSVGAEYRFDLGGVGSLTPRVDYTFQGKVYFTPYNFPVAASQDAYAKTNASIRYEPAEGSWTLMAYVRNIEDKVTKSNGLIGSVASVSAVEGYYDPPRTFGMMLSYRF